MATKNTKTEIETNETSEAAEKKTVPTVKKVFLRKPEGTVAKAQVVGVNGVMYTVPYNKEVGVPLHVAEVIERSKRYAERAEAESERIASELTD